MTQLQKMERRKERVLKAKPAKKRIQAEGGREGGERKMWGPTGRQEGKKKRRRQACKQAKKRERETCTVKEKERDPQRKEIEEGRELRNQQGRKGTSLKVETQTVGEGEERGGETGERDRGRGERQRERKRGRERQRFFKLSTNFGKTMIDRYMNGR